MATNSEKEKTELIVVPQFMEEAHKIARDKTAPIEKKLSEVSAKGVNPSTIRDSTWKVEAEKYGLHFIDNISLVELLEKVLILGGIQGYTTFLSTYHYVYICQKLGKRFDTFRPQEVLNTLLGHKRYNMSSKDTDLFIKNIIALGGIQFISYNKQETLRQRKEGKISKDDIIETKYRLLDFDHLVKNEAETRYRAIQGFTLLPFFENMSASDYNKLSRLFIPHARLLQIPNDRNKNHRRGFMTLVCMRLSMVAQTGKDFLIWDLEQCLRVGQWKVETRKRTQAWQQILQALDAGLEQGLITYEVIFKHGKPCKIRNIEKVKIIRLYSVDPENITVDFLPEQLELPLNTKKLISNTF